MRIPQFLSVLLFAAFAATASAQEVIISEFMAAGQYAVADEDGDFSDWLEIHNSGAAPLNLSGWHLTDKADAPAKWTLPAITLPANGYLLVFASGKNRAQTGARLHTNFSLDADGEYLALTRPDGSVAFKFDPYPLQLPDVAYDNAGRFLGLPTPGAANNPTEVAIAAAPQFSEAHGFKTRTFALTLTTATAGASIRYTLDGSEPGETAGALYTAPISLAKTTVVRAVAFSESVKASPIVTRTFLFVRDIVTQSANGKAPAGWPSQWPEHKTDYGMDPRITGVAPYKALLRGGLAAIPSISIVMPLESLFDEERGLYVHPQERTKEWERVASIELIQPDGTPGFAVNGGLRIRGGASRDSSNPKHALRVFFRRSYGAPRLEFPLFGADGSPTSDKFDLRCDQISSWHWAGDPKDDFIRDQWGRDTQLAMGQPAGRGDFYHLYLNGQYWGLYNTQERHDAAFGAQYFGGNEDDYDVVKYDNTSGGTNDADGTIASWRRLHDAAFAGFETDAKYQRVQGRNPDGTRNPAYERLVDVDNLIDYMLLGVYSAASDNPPSGGTQNNWGAIKSRKGDFGFRFFIHDWELSMFNATDNVVAEQPTENPLAEVGYTGSNVWHIWQALRFNAEFRLRVADRIQRHFFDGGALTPEQSAARFQARMTEISFAVIGESARWGDSFFKNGGIGGGPIFVDNDILPGPGETSVRRLLTRQDWVQATRVAFLQNYFPQRTAIVLQQLKDGGLYPTLDVPAITPGSGNVAPSQTIALTNPNATGAIYFTLDGSDPRALGGGLASSAQLYSAPFLLGPLMQLKARIKDGGTWSALVVAKYENAQDFSALQITEIGYGFRAQAAPGDDYDFIELKNAGAVPLDLSGLLFEQGVTYAFPAGTMLAPGAFYVIGRNAQRFAEAHPGQTLDGVFTGRLSDTGENLGLSAGAGVPLISLNYSAAPPWPPAGAAGFTIVRADDGDPDNAKNWRASTHPGGSPHADDPAPPVIPRVVINELLSRPASGPASIELANLGDLPADVSGWWLTSDALSPTMFPIAAGTIIPPRGFLALPFAASESGGQAFVFSATAAGALTGYAHGFDYEVAEVGVSFGRLLNSDGDEKFVAQNGVTLGAVNAGLRPSPVVVSEVNYFPGAGGDEFVELRNCSAAAVALGGWKLDGFGFTFPSSAELPAGALAVVVNGTPAAFRTKYNVPTAVAIFGPATGSLQNDGENLALRKPVTFAGVPGTFFQTLESVRYNDKVPWPWEAAGFGASLQRPVHAPFADDPASWLGAAPTPGLANTVNAAPAIALTNPLPGAVITPPTAITFAADAADPDGTITKVEFLSDSLVVGEDTSAPFSFAWTGAEPGQHDLTARAIDDSGNATESESVGVFVENPAAGTGRGLLGEYFTNQELAGDPVVSRRDGPIDFQWGDIDPAPGVSRAAFSVRWTGKYMPPASGETQITVQAAGGVRLFLDGELLIDEWANEEPLDFFATLNAIAGQPVEVRLEYRDGDGYAAILLASASERFFGATALPIDALYDPTSDPFIFDFTTSATLPTAQIGVPFRLQFRTAHGVSPVTFKVESVEFALYPGFNQSIPPGMSLSDAGILSGTPSQAGRYGFFVTGTDAIGRKTVFSPGNPFLITVLPAGPPVRPTVTIAAPLERAKFVGDFVNFSGSATSARGIKRVEYALNGGVWRPVTLVSSPTTQSAVTFTTSLDIRRNLFAGENTLLVRAIDSDGTASRIVTRRFSVRQFAPLTVEVQGLGTISPEFLGTTRREIGRTYTVRATPGRGQIFKWWQEGNFGGSPTPSYTFTMYRGLKLTAVFIPNPFPALAGNYIASVGSELERSDARGLLAVTITRNGAFTARLAFGGASYPIRGRFDSTGYFFKPLENGGIIFNEGRPEKVRDAFFGGLDFTLNANFETGEIFAYLNNYDEANGFNLVVTPQRSRWSEAGQPPCPLAGYWTVLIPGGGEGRPANTGFANLQISTNGAAKLRGTLADGARWIAASRVDDRLALPLFSPLYRSAGSFSGELQFVTQDRGSGSGDFFWQRPAGLPGTPFPEGFAFHAAIEATRYIGVSLHSTSAKGIVRDVAGDTLATFALPISRIRYAEFPGPPINANEPTALYFSNNYRTGDFVGTWSDGLTNTARRVTGVVDERTGTFYGAIQGTPFLRFLEIRGRVAAP